MPNATLNVSFGQALSILNADWSRKHLLVTAYDKDHVHEDVLQGQKKNNFFLAQLTFW
jgi:hypothetical protein